MMAAALGQRFQEGKAVRINMNEIEDEVGEGSVSPVAWRIAMLIVEYQHPCNVSLVLEDLSTVLIDGRRENLTLMEEALKASVRMKAIGSDGTVMY